MKIISSWDDGSKSDLKIAELMNKYKIPTIFYWTASMSRSKDIGNAKSWLSTQECKEIASNFEIGSHSYTHRCMKKLSIPQLAMEITDSRKYWQDTVSQDINSFAYPKNSITSLSKALVKGAGYKTARSYIVGCLNGGNDEYKIECTIQVGIDRVEYKNKSWELFFEEMIGKTTEDSIFHIFGNSWEIEKSNDWENLENFLKRITENFQPTF
jgi:peptidoglycan/xylan/chitin deacetylase (PgdA/CDA1 family)